MNNSSNLQKVLVTGGCGYIGSHTCIALIESGFEPIIVDNLSNSSPEVLNRIEQITGNKPIFHELDARDEKNVSKIFEHEKPIGIIHFAAYKAVGESVSEPIKYFDNNINSTLSIAKLACEHNTQAFIFSSSATVYSPNQAMPLTETSSLGATNPYGQTKLICEQILNDIANSQPSLKIANLRYFNPIGAHPSGLIGEDPKDIPNNLMPYITQVATKKLNQLSIFGADYPTHDGTGVRDYIHVQDLAKGHVQALEKLLNKESDSFTVNLGTGTGYSVLEVVKTFETVNEVAIPYIIVDRRPGDIATCYADTQKAEQLIGFKSEYELNDMCLHAWNWQKNNPNGYRS